MTNLQRKIRKIYLLISFYVPVTGSDHRHRKNAIGSKILQKTDDSILWLWRNKWFALGLICMCSIRWDGLGHLSCSSWGLKRDDGLTAVDRYRRWPCVQPLSYKVSISDLSPNIKLWSTKVHSMAPGVQYKQIQLNDLSRSIPTVGYLPWFAVIYLNALAPWLGNFTMESRNCSRPVPTNSSIITPSVMHLTETCGEKTQIIH